MANFQSPEVNVREVRAATPQTLGAPTTIAGMTGRTLQGPANVATFIDSFTKFVRIFGGYHQNSYAPEQVELFFKNGGTAMYFTRVVGSSGGGAANTKAAFTLNTAGAVAAVPVTAVGPGVYGNSLKVITANSSEVIATANNAIRSLLTAGSLTTLPLTDACAARLFAGDTIKLADGTTTIRQVITRIDGNNAIIPATTLGANMTAALTAITRETFELRMESSGAVVAGPYRNLRMSPLSLRDYFVTRINTGSEEALITVTDSAAPVGATSLDNRPVNTVATGDALVGGDEFTTFADNDYIGSSGSATGLYAFDKLTTVRAMSIPGVTGSAGAVTAAGHDYCANRADMVFICVPPAAQTPAQTLTFKTSVGTGSFGAWYYPWPQIISPLTGAKVATPPDGLVLGMWARTDDNRGIGKAPAGEDDGRLLGTVGVERELSKAEKDLLYPSNVNPIENIPNKGVCVMGSRTADAGEFNQLHKRRTFIYLRLSMTTATRFALFEPNTAATRAKVRRVIEAFLKTEWERGTLDGDTLLQAFVVVCDETTNPPEARAQGKMLARVGVNIPNTTEFLGIDIMHDQTLATL